jgi:hypothetical protein
MKSFFFYFLMLVCSYNALAHPMPGTVINLFVHDSYITGEARIPLIELGNAVGEERTTNLADPFFTAYFNEHIKAFSNNQYWRTGIQNISSTEETDPLVGTYTEVILKFTLTPPDIRYMTEFAFYYDAVIHQVVTHSALVSVQQDWNNGIDEKNAREIGIIALDIPSQKILPLDVNLGKGNLWTGFTNMVRLGMQHIREGTDHLLFLLVLLVPCMLLIKGKTWGGFGGTKYSLIRLIKIVTAFTIGHSITLLLGALGWVKLPGQPVEILIAVSILVSAVHAWRPVFPGKEVFIASGFGLVHGLAFASILSDLHLTPTKLGLSVLGFNIGVELMQLLIVALVVPWLLLLSKTTFYNWIRKAIALSTAIAAIGWIAQRTTGTENFITDFVEAVSAYPLWTFAVLALVSLILYFISVRTSRILIISPEQN